jgi:hypothetical protein
VSSSTAKAIGSAGIVAAIWVAGFGAADADTVNRAPELSRLDRLVSDVRESPIWYDRDDNAHRLWLYVSTRKRKFTAREIDEISQLLRDDRDDVVVYWAAAALNAIGPNARRATPVVREVEAQKACYFLLHPDELTVQNTPDALKRLLKSLGGAPEPVDCDPYRRSPPTNSQPSHPDLPKRIAAARAEAVIGKNDTAAHQLYDFVYSGLSKRYSDTEIDTLAELLRSKHGPLVYWTARSLQDIGPDARRRAAPVFQEVTQQWECYFQAHPAPRQMQTVRYPLERTMAILSIERLPLECGPHGEANSP